MSLHRIALFSLTIFLILVIASELFLIHVDAKRFDNLKGRTVRNIRNNLQRESDKRDLELETIKENENENKKVKENTSDEIVLVPKKRSKRKEPIITTLQIAQLEYDIDQAFMIMSACLVFFMQAGFAMVETGTVRVKNTKNMLLKGLLSYCLVCVGWWISGFAIAFGNDPNVPLSQADDFAGSRNFFLLDIEDTKEYSYFFYEMCFAGICAAIVSGGIAERTNFLAFCCNNFILVTIAYPCVAHWEWGGGWLSKLGENGHLDFAGDGPVHIMGGTCALVGAVLAGPRFEKFIDGKPKTIIGYSLTLVALGVFILWFGWYGFNPGSTLGLSLGKSLLAGKVAVNTSVAASTAAIVGYVTFSLMNLTKEIPDLAGIMNSVIAGLVAITGPCGYVEPWAAVVIGGVGTLVYIVSTRILLLMRIDDPVEAVAVHLAVSVWGSIATGLFCTQENIFLSTGIANTSEYGAFYGGGGEQLGIQLLGAVVIFFWAVFWSTIGFSIAKFGNFLTLTRDIQKKGLDSFGYGANSWSRVQITDSQTRETEEVQFRIQ